MKNFFSKNILIGLLLFTNGATGAYILNTKATLKGSSSIKPAKSKELKSPKKKRGHVSTTALEENEDLQPF